MGRARSTRAILVLALLGGLGAATGRARAQDAPAAPAPVPTAPVEQVPDVFAETLAAAGLSPGSLGYRPKGTWARYPVDVPYKMPFFDDLLAEPQSTYEFTRTLGNAVEDILTPERLATPPAERDAPGSLYRLGVVLGTDRSIGGFRGFGYGLLPPRLPEGPAPTLLGAIGSWLIANSTGMEANNADQVPEAARAPLAQLLVDLADADHWLELGLRRVPTELREAVFKALPRLVESTPDAAEYFPMIDDVSRLIDEHLVAYGALKALEALQRARWALAAARPKDGWPAFHMMVGTRRGDVVFMAGQDGKKAEWLLGVPAVLVSLQGPCVVASPVATTGPDLRLSVALILDGRFEVRGSPAGPMAARTELGGLGTGILGCGILYSAGVHDDVYEAQGWGLGAGLFGMGVLVDEGGNDSYRVRKVGEGAALFGAGLLLDAAGDDSYELLEGDGQGFGGPGGIGVLADRSGNDHYFAEPRADKAGRPDYHSDGKIASSNAQGAGMGRRGDLTDGHAWAGGLGALLDVDGDDHYEAGNFSQGVGYWFGTGLLWDGGGDDAYRSVYFSHGSGAHFAVGAVIDEGGNDLHSLSDFAKVGLGPKAGAGIGFGWDVVNAICLDRDGDDLYEADIISIGCAEIRSNGWLLDEAGDDTYVAAEGALAFGAVDDAPRYSVPDRVSPFTFHIPQLGLFLDLGGTDKYQRRPTKGGDPVPDLEAKDDASWGKSFAQGPGGAPNVARGRDAAKGRLGFLDAWPRRVAK